MSETPDSFPPSFTEKDSTAKWCHFFSILILVAGSIVYSSYQISDEEDRLADLTLAVNQTEPQVKQADYERSKLYSLAGGVLRLSRSDRNAAQIVAEYKIRQTTPTQATLDVSPGP